MKFRKSSSISVPAVCAALAMAPQLFAQDNHAKHHVYRLSEIGTFGGPSSDFADGPAYAYEPNYFNVWGAAVGTANSAMADPFSPNCFFNCYATYAFVFHDGHLTNLGALPGASNSAAYGINDKGLVAGLSETGSTDPATGYPEYHAVVWRDRAIRDLGTLGGAVSQAFALNDCGQVVGVAENDEPDQYAAGLGPATTWNWPVTNQLRAFLWEGGALEELGTLGGDDAAAYFINRAGQVAGISYTNTTANATTGLPTQDPFLWDPISHKMTDLGTLGGTHGVVYGLNNRGQIVGNSNLAGDQTFHGFFWDRGVMRDVGTLGGDISGALWLNDAGDVVGTSYLTGNQNVRAYLWRDGRMRDLGTLKGDTDSAGISINAEGTIVGQSFTSTTYRAFVRREGGPMVDLNALVEPPSDLHLSYAFDISDRGEIYAYGQLPNGDVRVAVLTPEGDCDSDCERRIAEFESNPPQMPPAGTGSAFPISGKLGDPFAGRVRSSTGVTAH